MIQSGPHTSFHNPLFRRAHSPSISERNSTTTALSFTKLPSIHSLLPSQSRQDVLHRPRGSTLPSYHSSEFRRSNDSSTASRTKRISSADRGDVNVTSPRLPPGGISLPPIRVETQSSPTHQRTFTGLPPIKTMLPSPPPSHHHRDHHHMPSIGSHSPASPQSSSNQSIALLSSSWSSNNPGSSGGDITGRFHPHSIDSKYHQEERSHSPPQDDDRSFRRSNQNNKPPTRSSLLSLTAPRPPRSILSDSHPPVSYASQRTNTPRGEDVIMTTPSNTTSPYPNSLSLAGPNRSSARAHSQEDTKYAHTVEYAATQQQQYMYTSPGGPDTVPGSFESSENEAGRLKPGETAGGKKRRSRATQEQLDLLNAVYQRTPFPTTVERNELAHRLGMTPRSVQIWFQNKRQGAKHSESRRRELPPLALNSTRPGSPQLPNMVPLTLVATSPPSPAGGSDARSMSYGAETRRDMVLDTNMTGGDLRGRARRRRMSVNDLLLRQDARDELRPGAVVGSAGGGGGGGSRYIGRQRPEEMES